MEVRIWKQRVFRANIGDVQVKFTEIRHRRMIERIWIPPDCNPHLRKRPNFEEIREKSRKLTHPKCIGCKFPSGCYMAPRPPSDKRPNSRKPAEITSPRAIGRIWTSLDCNPPLGKRPNLKNSRKHLVD